MFYVPVSCVLFYFLFSLLSCLLAVLFFLQSLESDFAAVIQEKDDSIRNLKRELADYSASVQHLDRGGSDRSR